MEIDDLPPRDERIDRRRIEQRHIDIALRHVGGLDERRSEILEERLGLGVAQHRLRRQRLGDER